MVIKNSFILFGCLMVAGSVIACSGHPGIGDACTKTSECKTQQSDKVACVDNGTKKVCTSVCVDKSDCSGTEMCRDKGFDVDGKLYKQCAAFDVHLMGKACTSNDDCKGIDGVCSTGVTGTLSPRCVPSCVYRSEDPTVDNQCVQPGDYPMCYPAVKTVDGKYYKGGCGACDYRHALNKVNAEVEYNYWVFDKANPELASQPQPVCDQNKGLCTITNIVNGAYLVPNVDDRSLVYLDMDKNKYLAISDEEAIEENKDWDVGFAAWSLLTNGGQLPGNIKVAVVQGDQSAFEKYSLAEARTIPDSDFIDEDLIDVPNCIMKEHKAKGGGRLVPQAVDRLMQKLPKTFYREMVYRYDSKDHFPHVQPGFFFVLKDTKRPDWYAKMKMDDIHVDNRHLLHTFSYGLLK